MNKISILLGLAVSVSPAWAVTITPITDSTQLAGELVAGTVLDSSKDIKIEGAAGQIGTFENLVLHGAKGTSLELANGIVLSTGDLNGLPTSNTVGYYGSEPLGGNGDGVINAFPIEKFNRGGSLSHDAAVIRFRFDAPTGVTGVVARFVYASEEFPEFSGTQYADGFAFVRSETTANGDKKDVNYAILPNGDPVSLLDQGTNIHFMANGNANNLNVPGVVDLEFDGITRILTVKAPVTAGAKEDFSLVIADTGDGIYDSAVFISALTFFSDPGFDFSIGSVALEDNPASNGFVEPAPLHAPLPASAWFFFSGLAGLLASIRRNKASSYAA